MFSVTGLYTSVQSPEAVYQVIKNYVEAQIARMQKNAFYKNTKNEVQVEIQKNIVLDEKQKELYYELVDNFKMLLWEEPITVYDITHKGSYHRLGLGFEDVQVPI